MNLDDLRVRADLLGRLRAFFRERGFLEVETPIVSREVIPERHIGLMGLSDGERWLQASPEMHHKRLLCAGSGPIFEVARVFRDSEWGKHHNPEFTMVEWYRPGDDMHAGMDLLDELLRMLLDAPRARRTSYREAFVSAVGIDPLEAPVDSLRAVAESNPGGEGLDLGAANRDELLNVLLATRVEATLGVDAPELLYHYPASQAALATTATDARGVAVAERFELYWRGVELANGYRELTDGAELRRRLERANADRVDAGWPALPLPERLLEAMADPGLPPCAGVALGFDRLVMLATGAKNLGEVMAFSEFD